MTAHIIWAIIHTRRHLVAILILTTGHDIANSTIVILHRWCVHVSPFLQCVVDTNLYLIIMIVHQAHPNHRRDFQLQLSLTRSRI